MTMLIVGSTGMLGQALCREALRRGERVAGAANCEAEYSLDIGDAAALTALLEEVRPEVVINTAAITSLSCCESDPAAAYLVNARAVSVMAAHCSRLGSYFVQVSTDHYFCGDGDSVHPEDAEVQLVNEYARSKYAGECFALTNPRALVLRTNIVGFRNWKTPTFAEWAIAALEKGSAMTLFDDFYTSSIDVTAFAAALFDLLPSRTRGILNLAAHGVASKKTFIGLLAAALGRDAGKATAGSVKDLTDARRAESLGLDVTRAERLLGYQLPSTEQVVAALVDEYRRMTP